MSNYKSATHVDLRIELGNKKFYFDQRAIADFRLKDELDVQEIIDDYTIMKTKYYKENRDESFLNQFVDYYGTYFIPTKEFVDYFASCNDPGFLVLNCDFKGYTSRLINQKRKEDFSISLHLNETNILKNNFSHVYEVFYNKSIEENTKNVNAFIMDFLDLQRRTINNSFFKSLPSGSVIYSRTMRNGADSWRVFETLESLNYYHDTNFKLSPFEFFGFNNKCVLDRFVKK